MKTYLTTALLTFSLTASVFAQTVDDNNPKSPNRHHTRPPYTGPAKHHPKSRPLRALAPGQPPAHQPKPRLDHVAAQ
jgi:hypothetical protein